MRDYRLHIGLLVGAMSMLLMGFNKSPGIMEFNTSPSLGSSQFSCPTGSYYDFQLKKCVAK